MKKSTKLLLAAALALGLTGQAKADFLEGSQTSPPGQIQVIGSHYEANSMDAKGKEKSTDLQRTVFSATIKGKDDMMTIDDATVGVFGMATIPYIYASNGAIDESVGGLGDITLEAGPYISTKQLDVLVTGRVKTSSGEYDASHKLNLGSGQVDVGACVRSTLKLNPVMIDNTACYDGRREKPADRVTDMFTPSVGIGDHVRIGLETNAAYSTDSSFVRVGPIGRYTLKDGTNITATCSADVLTYNATNGVGCELRLRVPLSVFIK